MKFSSQSICVILAIAGVTCSAQIPNIIQEMHLAAASEDKARILNRIATNMQERAELFAYMNARPDFVAETKAELLAASADQTDRLSLRPVPLDLRSSSTPQLTCEGLNYTFSTPWPEFVETERSEGQWVAFQDPHGRMIMLAKPMATNTFDDVMMDLLLSTTNDYTWIHAFAFPNHTNDQGVAFYRECLNVTPHTLYASETMGEVYQYLARMTIKALLLSGMTSPLINDVRLEGHEGIQIHDTSKPGRYLVRLFDNFGEQIDLVFGFKKEHGAAISQADVNCVLLSLKKTYEAEQPVAGHPPQDDGPPEP